MTLITMPTDPVAAEIDWTIEQPGQANRSEFTGRRRVTLLSAAPRWFATVKLPAILGEDRAMAWRAFAVDVDGIANSFRVIACEREQIVGAIDIRIAGSGQGGHTLVTSGWGSAGIKLKRGQFVTVGDQLLMLTAPVVADANGRATLFIKPYVRVVPTDNAPVEVKRPYAVMAMSDPKSGWNAGRGQTYGVEFNCEEAF